MKNKKNHTKKCVNEEILYKDVITKLENNYDIYLLDFKLKSIKDNNKIYAIIFKKEGSISHKHCIDTTKVIQECIKMQGYNDGDYSITVSSAGLRWKIEDRFELFIDMPIKIKYRIENNNNEENNDTFITTYAILKEVSNEYIIIEDEDDNNVKIKKENIIKIRLDF